MRIAIANHYVRITGGADLHCVELAKGLRSRGHEVAFLSTKDPRNLDDVGEFIPAIVSGETRDGVAGAAAVGVVAAAMWNRSAARAAQRLFGEFKPDVVHAHKLYPQLSVAPVAVAARKGIPIVQTVHDYEFIAASALNDRGGWLDRDQPQARYRAVNSMLFGIKRLVHSPRVARWIAVSRSTGRAYSAGGIDADVIPNFTQVKGVECAGYGVRHGVLFAGRLTPEKGVEHVLQMAEELPDIPVSIAGSGVMLSQVKEAVGRIANVEYIGALGTDEVGVAMEKARVIVMPSMWREPGPLSALEAMSVGTPIVAYNNGGLAEYIEDASGGIVVDANARQLARTVAKIYRDSENWRHLSTNAQKAVRKRHTLPVYLDNLERIYQDAAGRSACGSRR